MRAVVLDDSAAKSIPIAAVRLVYPRQQGDRRRAWTTVDVRFMDHRDPARRARSTGQACEIEVCCWRVARGYLDLPEQTEATLDAESLAVDRGSRRPQ